MACSLKFLKYGLYISMTLLLLYQVIVPAYVFNNLQRAIQEDIPADLGTIWIAYYASLIVTIITIILGFHGTSHENLGSIIVFAFIMGISFVYKIISVIYLLINRSKLLRASDILKQHESYKRGTDQFLLNLADSGLYIGLGAAVVLLIPFIFAYCLANQLRNKRKTGVDII